MLRACLCMIVKNIINTNARVWLVKKHGSVVGTTIPPSNETTLASRSKYPSLETFKHSYIQLPCNRAKVATMKTKLPISHQGSSLYVSAFIIIKPHHHSSTYLSLNLASPRQAIWYMRIAMPTYGIRCHKCPSRNVCTKHIFA